MNKYKEFLSLFFFILNSIVLLALRAFVVYLKGFAFVQLVPNATASLSFCSCFGNFPLVYIYMQYFNALHTRTFFLNKHLTDSKHFELICSCCCLSVVFRTKFKILLIILTVSTDGRNIVKCLISPSVPKHRLRFVLKQKLTVKVPRLISLIFF